MKKLVKTLSLVSLLTFSIGQANAGLGIAYDTVRGLLDRQSSTLLVAGASVSIVSITYGINQVRYGSWPLGVFLILLNENDIISDEGLEALEGLEVSTKEAFIEIMASDLTQEEKEEELALLFE